MPFELKKRVDPELAKVIIQVRVEARYRNQLAALAEATGTSMNQLLLAAVEAAYPPEVTA